MMSKFQILQVKGEITFNNNNKLKSLLLLNFWRATILDFYDVMAPTIVYSTVWTVQKIVRIIYYSTL